MSYKYMEEWNKLENWIMRLRKSLRKNKENSNRFLIKQLKPKKKIQIHNYPEILR